MRMQTQNSRNNICPDNLIWLFTASDFNKHAVGAKNTGATPCPFGHRVLQLPALAYPSSGFLHKECQDKKSLTGPAPLPPTSMQTVIASSFSCGHIFKPTAKDVSHLGFYSLPVNPWKLPAGLGKRGQKKSEVLKPQTKEREREREPEYRNTHTRNKVLTPPKAP